MIEYALLAQLYQQPRIDVQESVQAALARPKVVSVSGSPEPLEGRLEAQARSARTIPLNQVKEILSKTYIDPKTDFRRAYSDLVTKGRTLIYALENFPYEFSDSDVVEYNIKVLDFYVFNITQNAIYAETIVATRNADLTNRRTKERLQMIGKMSYTLYELVQQANSELASSKMK